MNKLFIKASALLLATLMCTGLLSACNEEETDTTEEQTTLQTDDYEKDNLPDSLNYGGKDVNIVTWEETLEVDFASEYKGNIINDQTYTSRKNVESRLNVKFNVTAIPGNWDNRNSFVSTLDTNLMAGEAYDIIGQYTPAAAIGAMKGLYKNLNDSEYLNFSKPWWPGNIQESCSIGGNVYFCSGDITATCINAIGMVAVNLDMMKEFKIEENIYDVVNNKQWTMEKMKTMFLGLVGTVPDEPIENNRYAITMINRGVYDNLFFSGGLRFIEHDNEDQLVISSDLTEGKMESWYSICNELLHNNADVVSGTINTDITIENTFMSGRSFLFMSQELNDVKNYLKDATFDFAVVPYPMYNEDQQNYYSITGYWVTIFSIPYNVKDTGMSEAVLEALGSDAYRTLTPTVYTNAFQYRFLETLENAEMLDLIHDSIVYDTGRIFADDMEMFNVFRQSHEGVHSWVTVLAEKGKLWKSNIEKVTITLG